MYPVIETLTSCLKRHKLVISTGGGLRSRHVFSIGIDLGLPTGVLAQLAMADALASAHIIGTLLAPAGVVAIPPEILGHLLPLFIERSWCDLQRGSTLLAVGTSTRDREDPAASCRRRLLSARRMLRVQIADAGQRRQWLARPRPQAPRRPDLHPRDRRG